MTASRSTRPAMVFARALFAASVVAAIIALVMAIGTRASAADWITVVAALLFLWVGVAGRMIVERYPRNAAGWLLLCAAFGSSALALLEFVEDSPNLADSPAAFTVVAVLVAVLAAPVFALFTLGVLLFPDGRLPSPRWRPVAVIAVIALIVLSVSAALHPEWLPGVAPILDPTWMTITSVAVLACFGVVIPLAAVAAASVGVRRRRASGDLRSALFLFEIAAWINFGTWVACFVVSGLGTLPDWFGAAADQTGVVFAIVIWIGVVRFRLPDLRLAAKRTVVLAVLSAVVVGCYVLVATLLGSIASSWVSTTIAVAVAALVALPVRDGLQRLINQIVYGAPTEPIQTLAQLGRRLSDGADSASALQDAVRTIASTLKLASAGIEVNGELIASTEPAPTVAAERIPLVFAGDSVGSFVIASGRRELSPANRALLADLTPQLASAVHSVLLERALRASRELVVVARDNERRRIRRDLHDGLGPTLAGVVLGLEHAERHLDDPAAARASIARLHATSQDAVREVRRLVYALRPPALDSLGLGGAIRDYAERLGASEIETVELPDLPDGFEVGVYLIALEAMKNASSHARPGTFGVRLAVPGDLQLDVLDDGPGLPDDYRAGVGIRSMHDRAAELGGTLQITRRAPTGTLVRGRWPLPT